MSLLKRTVLQVTFSSGMKKITSNEQTTRHRYQYNINKTTKKNTQIHTVFREALKSFPKK